MRNAFTAALAAALVVASSDCAAHAWATAQIGDTSISQVGSGPNFGISFWNVTLGTGESVSETFDYRVTMHTDGLPATRTWDDTTVFGCMPLFEVKCGPAATGGELVEAYIETYQDGRVVNPFISFTGGFVDDLTYDQAGTGTVEGSFTVTATNLGIGPQSDTLGLVAALWVDSNDAVAAVPEPTNVALALAGLCAVAAGLARRSRRTAQLAA